MSSFASVIDKLASVDLFARDASGRPTAGVFVGNPFYLDYDRASLLVADAWKHKAGGLPQGAFLLAYYEDEHDVQEALLLRVLRPSRLPTDNDIVASMIEFYKENLRTSGANTQLDTFTRYEFSFSGVECRVLGTLYKDGSGQLCYGADVENFYSAHHYSIIKPGQAVLEKIVNLREGHITGRPSDIRIGCVRYSSSQRIQSTDVPVPVYITPQDFLGKRSALFGMTRTGKSNTVKKIIQATVRMSNLASATLGQGSSETPQEQLIVLTPDGVPKYPVGQIIFDVNGEYANANLQDEGTAIYEIYADRTSRYSVIEKPDFRVMRVNFYNDVESGFELVRAFLKEEPGDYVRSFLAVDLTPPQDQSDCSATTRHARRAAAYLCCLKRAGFTEPKDFRVYFPGAVEINGLSGSTPIDPSKGITLEQAVSWWTAVWKHYDHKYFQDYRQKKGREWADEDLKAILAMLTRTKTPGGAPNVSGYTKLRAISDQHTEQGERPFEVEIVEELRRGRIIIVDLSQGDPHLQRLFSERICQRIFRDSMQRFIATRPANFIQFYFEEAHNLFPKRDEKDLSQIYNRIAKEGAKLHLGMVYATQEVSSISANILKNTQNWFISHLNNEDETKELRKYYDFGDFTESLVRFSASSDRGFARMKTYSNPFVVPVQVDRFSSAED